MTKVLQELHTSKDMEGIERWEETILGKHLEEARQEAKRFLEWLDDRLREHCPAGWKVVGYQRTDPGHPLRSGPDPTSSLP